MTQTKTMGKKEINILFIGDIIGRFGRKVTKEVLPHLKKDLELDLIIANGENAASGYGITEKVYNELTEMGINAFTSGNHIWDKKEYEKNTDKFPNLVRPANYPQGTPGKEYLILDINGTKVAIFNLLGRVFITPSTDCPFKTADRILGQIKDQARHGGQAKIILVDVHAEATSEKVALFWYLNGRVSAAVGTHTHIQTSDSGVSKEGTAAITDTGMVSATESVIGMSKDDIIKRFLTQMPQRFEPAEKGNGIFNSVFLKIDTETGKALEIRRVNRIIENPSNTKD